MFIKEAWFWRGAQSAVFYYISCAPCTKVLDQRKKKQTAARAKAEKIARKAAQSKVVENGEQPDYDHPLPSSTNPFWEEEMQLGPGPPPKRRNHRHADGSERQRKEREDKEKAQKKSGSLEMAQVNGLLAIAKGGDGSISSKGLGGSETIDAPITEVPQIITQDVPDPDWNRRRYQREDELLWGLGDEDDESLTAKADGKKKGDSQLSRTSGSLRGQRSYYYARNPAVNDLHPPVVSTAPTNRSETQWMLQPPPRARIMEGKERENRSRSGTGSTHSSRASSKRAGLGRQLSNRAFEAMVMRSHGLADGTSEQLQGISRLGKGKEAMGGSRGSSKQSLVSGQRHDRDASSHGHPSPNSLQPSRSNSQRKAAPPPIALDNDPSFLSPSPMRPGLQTIPSTSLIKSPSNKQDEKRDNKESTFCTPKLQERTGLTGQEDTAKQTAFSTTALQDLLIPPSTNQINRSSSLHTRDDKKDHERIDAVDHPIPFPGAEKGWGAPNYHSQDRGGKADVANDENSEWLGENHRHRHRWSMDF